MFNSEQLDDSSSHTSEEPSYYKLPPVTSFSDVDKNFETLSSFVVKMTSSMETHAKVTNDNLTRLAEETNEVVTKLSADLKAIFSSQVMMLTICVIVIFFFGFFVKGAFDFVDYIRTAVWPS